eukprot:TRINITY_DN529_c0_g2_i3.p1 TRINITY_DN529_c0_g2~~TRINITY_DN529_c0_g2_i3.p1  ORF type:complete len:330 (-),score=50.95 TRINITY_DN529_c0_g2_i3:15-1004(-)
MDPNQQQPQYPPQFFYPVPGAVDPNQQQMYPPQGVPQSMMMQPGMVPPPYVVPQQPQNMMAPQTTGYVQSPVMTVAPNMGHNVVPSTIPQHVTYVTPAPDDVALLESPTPTLMMDRSIKERLYDREYTVDISAWVSEAWDIYKKNYAIFILWTLLSFGISWIPYVGMIVTSLMAYSLIAAVNDTLRPSRVVLNFKNFSHLFINMKYSLHMILLSFLTSLIVGAGLIALVVPGFYFLIVLAYTVPVYLEYRTLGLSLTESLFVSGKVLHKRFCGILGFFLICFLLLLAGALALGVGLLITYPLIYISMSVAFREIFAFRENHLYASEQQI